MRLDLSRVGPNTKVFFRCGGSAIIRNITNKHALTEGLVIVEFKGTSYRVTYTNEGFWVGDQTSPFDIIGTDTEMVKEELLRNITSRDMFNHVENITRILNDARCISKRTIGNYELAGRIMDAILFQEKK